MKISNEFRTRRLALAFLAGVLALLLTLGLSSLVSRFRVLAEPAATLEITKAVNTSQAGPGDTLTYTVLITNSTPGEVNAWLTDTLPDELTYVSDSLDLLGAGSAGFADGVITWTNSHFGWGQRVRVRFSATISPAIGHAEIVNTAEVTGTGSLVTNSVAVEVRPGVLEASKSVFPSSANRGEELFYTLHISNTGYTSVDTAVMTDALPAELNYARDLAATRGSWNAMDDVITWTGSLAPWEMVTITFVAEVSPTLGENTLITNTAEITGSGTLILAQAAAEGLADFKLYFPIIPHSYPPIPVLNPIPTPVDHSYDVSWQGVEIPIDYYVLQQARTEDFDTVEQDWVTTGLSQTVGDAYCAYYYRVRADKVYEWGEGPWSAPKLAQASPPDAPVLDNIPTPDIDGAFTLSWSEITIDGAKEYVIQESTSSNFAGVAREWRTNVTSLYVSPGSNYGDLYYRVRADDNDCWGQGPWSTVKSVSVPFVDYFDDSDSGWPDDRGEIYWDDDEEVWKYWRRGYKEAHGEYRIKIDRSGPLAWFYQPDALAPYHSPVDKYCVETRVQFEEGGYWANMGLIFGANDDNTDIYALCLWRDSHQSELGWFLMRNDSYDFPEGGCSSPTYKIEGWDRDGTSREGWNRLQVGVDGDEVTVYIGGNYKGQWTMDGLDSRSYVGVVGGTYEVTPIDIRYDYFIVRPGQACTP